MNMTKEDFLAEAANSADLVLCDEAESLLAKGIIVLDVREPAEFEVGHLPGAANVPRGVLEFRVGDHPALNDPEAEILIYCKNGGRSTLAAYTLKRMGFSKLKMLTGGFDGWSGTVHKVEIDPAMYQ
ncbi:MAG: rhodanese-like domain-containing protein [Reinekea sp.]